MKVRVLVVALGALAVAAVAGAQTKISGSIQCAKPDPQNMIEIGDRPNHMFAISKETCTWTKPMTLEGSDTKEGSDTRFSEISGDKSSDRGVHMSTMANGDKFTVRFQGASMLKNGAPQGGKGTWSFASGTGKLKGLTGKGTFKGTANPDGTTTFDVEGEYQIAAMAAPAKKTK